MKMSRHYCFIGWSCLFTLTCFVALRTAQAGSATWQLNPVDNNWDIANNWSPATVPNGPNDVATFQVSNITGVSMPTEKTLDGIVFNPGASAFTITPKTKDNVTLAFYNISGAGVNNNSGIVQSLNNFNLKLFWNFLNNSTAGDMVTYSWFGGAIYFANQASAGHATFNNNVAGLNFLDNASASYSTIFNNAGGELDIIGNATADHATITNAGNNVTSLGFAGHTIMRSGPAHGADATFICTGSNITNGKAGYIEFLDTAAAERSVLIASGGTFAGGMITFAGDSTGDVAQVQLSENGSLDVSTHSAPGLGIGSLEGAGGSVLLGANNLFIGANNMTTTFSGAISDGGADGSLTKVGRGSLTLTGASTYTGGTTVSAGNLVVANRQGSATGTGPVQVNAGKMGGSGIISGATTVGSGSGAGATLRPALHSSRQATLTIQDALTFNSDATYGYAMNSSRGTAASVLANGMTINAGAQFVLRDRDTAALPIGTVFTALSNTSASSIAGTFANLPAGGILTVGANAFRANYEGGDGNDLTLTVVPGP